MHRQATGAAHFARIGFIAALLACSLSPLATPQNVQPGDTVTLSIGPIAPPLFYLGQDGLASGFVPELLREAGRRAGITIEFELIPDVGTLLSLDPEDHQLVTWLIAEEHPEGYTEFQRSYLTLHGAVFRRRGGVFEEDMPAYKLGEVLVVANTEVEHDLLNNGWDSIHAVPTTEEAFQALESGQFDSIIVSEYLGLSAMESLGIHDIVRVNSTEMHMHHHVKLLRPRYRTDLERALSPAFDSMRNDGTFDQLNTKWFGKYTQKNVSLETYRYTTVAIGLGASLLALVLLFSRRRFRKLLSWQGEALEASETRLGGLIESVKAIVWDATIDAQFSYVSPYAETLLGYPLADWYKPNFFADVLLHPDDRGETVRVCLEASTLGHDHVLDYRVRSATGEVFWLHDMVKVIKDEAGRPIKLHGVMIDITSVRKAQQAAADSESRLSAIMKASPTGIVRLDRDGRVTFGNDEAGRITGLRGGEVNLERWMNAIHPEDREQVVNAWRRVSNKPTGDLREYRFLHPGGEVVWVLDRGHPEVDPNGNVTGYVATLTDITQLKQAEETIRTHSQVLMQLTEAVNFTDERGKILYTNAAFDKMFGYSAGELIGKDVSTLNHVSREDYQKLSDEIASALRADGSWVGEFRNRHRNRDEFWTRSRVFQIDGSPQRLAVCVQEDVTARRNAELALRESEERFRRVAESALIGIGLYDGSRFTFANQSLVRLFGYTVDDVGGINREGILAICADDLSREKVRDALRQIDEGPATIELDDVQVRRSNGELCWAQLTISRLYPQRPFPRLLLCVDTTERKRAEASLRTRSQVLMNMAEGVVFTDQSGMILETNPAYNAMFGYNAGELIGQSIIELTDLDPQEIDAIRSEIRGALAARGEWCGEFPNLRKDGSRLWTRARLTRAEADGRTGFVIVQEDITESRRAAEALKESEEKFRRVAESAFVGLAVHDGNEYVYSNDAMTRISGYTLEELGALSREKIASQMFYPEDQAHILARLGSLDGTGSKVEPAAFDDIRLRHKDGEPRWVSLMFSRMYPDKPMPRLTICIDRTDRKRAESALRESEALFRAITENIPDCVFLLDYSNPEVPGAILYANESAARMHGMTIGEIIGRSIVDLRDPASINQGIEIRRRILAGETVMFESVHRRSDGSLFPVEIVAQRIDALGPNKVLAIDRDLTERRQIEDERLAMEQRMLQAQKLESLGILAGGIAHDFNNLLVGILGHADLAREDLEDSGAGAAAESLEQIEIAARRAAELTHQMLAYSGKGKFFVQRIHLDKTVREMAKLLEVSLSKKAVLRFELEPDTPPIEADSAQIQQVVMNLITNASDALENRTGVITLRTGVADYSAEALRKFTLGEPPSPGRFVYLEVTDTGCGMDQPTLQRMFDPFFTTKFSGRGLGLASVLGIVRSHQGGLSVSSRPGAGTSFRVILPVAPGTAGIPRENGHDEPAGRHAGGTVLVVDDEPRVLDLVARALGRSGYDVLTAQDGPAAIGLFEQHAAEVCGVVIDWTMPGMSGAEVLAELRSRNRDLPVLFISGYASSEMAGDVPDDGRTAFLQKPFSIDVLRRTVDSMLSATGDGVKVR